MRFVAVTSQIERLGTHPLTALREQLGFLERVGIATELWIDPSPIEFELRIRRGGIDCVYLTPMRAPGEDGEDTRLLSYHMAMTRLMQQLGQPFIGQDFTSQLSINDKVLCSFITGCHPPGWLITRNDAQHGIDRRLVDEVPRSAFPLLVKPNTLWASLGIGRKSIANSQEDALQIIGRVFQEFPHLGELRLEKLIVDAREATVSVTGNGSDLVIGVTELVAIVPDIHLNDAQEKTASPEQKSIIYRSWPEDEFRPVLEQLGRNLFQKFAFRDVARFDIMIGEKPFVIDVNDMPFMGNAFSHDWCVRYGLRQESLLAVLLSAFLRRATEVCQPSLSPAFWATLPAPFRFGRR